MVKHTNELSMGFGAIIETSAVWGLASELVGELTHAIKEAAEEMIGFNARMEQAHLSMQTMLGSAEAATVLLQEMQDFAAHTPFQFEDLDQAAKKLLAFGWSAHDIIPDLTTMGNAIAALGLGAPGLDRVTLALGQMSQMSHANGMEIRRLNELGISAQKYIVDAFHINASELDKLGNTGITGAQAVKAILEGMAQDPRFKDMMQVQSQTMVGLWTTVKDNAQMILGKIGETAFDSSRDVVRALGEMSTQGVEAMRSGGLAGLLDGLFGTEWAARIWTIKDEAGDLWTALVVSSKDLLAILGPLAGELADEVGRLAFMVESVEAAAFAIDDLLKGIKELGSEIPSLTQLWNKLDNSAWDWNRTMDEAIPILPGIRQGIADLAEQMGVFAEATKIASTAASAFSSILDLLPAKTQHLSFAQSLDFTRGAKVGGSYEDMSSRLVANQHQKGLDDIANHKGVGLNAEGGKPDKGANTTARMMEQFQNTIETQFDTLNAKIMSETDSTYAVGLNSIQDEVGKMSRELDKQALALSQHGVTVDTSGIKAEMDKFSKVMVEPLRRNWTYAWQDLKNQTSLSLAQITGSVQGAADAQYQIDLLAIRKEQDAREKAVMLNKGDEEAMVAVANWAKDQKIMAAEKMQDAITKGLLASVELDRHLGQDRVDQNQWTLDQMYTADLSQLAREKKILEYRMENDKTLSDDARKTLQIQLNGVQKTINETGAHLDPVQGMTAGFQKAYRDMGTFADNMKQAALATAQAMSSSFSDFFFDAMTGQLKSMGAYVTSFLESVARAIANAMANAYAQKIMGMFFGNTSSDVNSTIPAPTPTMTPYNTGSPISIPARAGGGPVSEGQTYLVGENGPELFTAPATGGITNAQQTAAAAAGGSGSGGITVNLNNNTGTNMAPPRVTQRSEGKRMVVDVWLEAYRDNTGGLRTALQGSR